MPPAPAPAWFPGTIHVESIVIALALAFLYLRAWRVRGQRVAWQVAARGLTALAMLVLSQNGPLHDLADHYLFSAHMAQHLLLTLVVPPLALAGMPAWMVDAILRPVLSSRVAAWILRRLTRPVPALVAYTVALVVWHLPGPYELALTSHAWHVAEHAMLIAAATLGWWPVLSPSALSPALPYGGQILYLFAFGMPMTVVAAMITGAEQVLYPFYADAPRITALAPLDDQRLGGLIMWVPAGLIPLIAFTAVFFRWVASEPEDSFDAPR